MSPNADDESDFYVYKTLKRGERDLDSKFSAYQLALLEDVFKDEKYTEKAAKRSSVIEKPHRHKIHRRNAFSTVRLPKIRSTQRRKIITHRNKMTNRNVVPSYFYEPIDELKEEISDEYPNEMRIDPVFTMPPPLNTIATPNVRGLQMTTKKTLKLDQKVLEVLKRVGLGLVTISDLSLEISASMKEVIMRVSGKAAPKGIGGWFNFEVIRKDIFAVAFTAEQAGFEDFVQKMFNTKIGLLEKLEKTSVSILL